MTKKGFTLAEILIALAIMATIAVFTIPKMLDSSADSDNENWKRAVKQGVSVVQAAYTQYRLDNRSVPSTFHLNNATQYLDYVRIETALQIDGTPCFGAPISCWAANTYCYRLKNGSVLQWNGNEGYNGTGSLNAIKWRIDPDGKVTGPAGQDPGKAIVFYTYYVSGKTRDRDNIDPNTTGGFGTDSPNSACTPNWWSWN